MSSCLVLGASRLTYLLALVSFFGVSFESSPLQDTLAVASNYGAWADIGINTLQQWYNSTTGLWATTGWWNSANCVTLLTDYALVNAKYAPTAESVLANTLVNAQTLSIPYFKTMDDGIMTTYMGTTLQPMCPVLPHTSFQGFINDYYDDEGWWALAWLKAYDLTGNSQYLQTAVNIFQDMTGGWNATCGGLWWNKSHTANNAIENELFLTVAAQLANRCSANKCPNNMQYYLDWANKEWTWFQHSGMINSKFNINDGLSLTTCKNNNGIVWSYNQGVILGGLVELNKASPNAALLQMATEIANAAISLLCDSNGILHDPCEPNCGADGSQFKGIFMRNLQILQQASPSSLYATTIEKNANSIWASDRNNQNQLGLIWTGPASAITASTQSSAGDALVAAAAIASSSLVKPGHDEL